MDRPKLIKLIEEYLGPELVEFSKTARWERWVEFMAESIDDRVGEEFGSLVEEFNDKKPISERLYE